MPIRPENRTRYPANWREIRARIMERADNRCECRGECGHEHEDRGLAREALSNGGPARCAAPHGHVIVRHMEKRAWFITAEDVDRGFTAEDDPYELEGVKVVLTIGHLDHTPENCADENLRAWCQLCHLSYDRHEHVKNARRTRHARKAAGELF